MNLIKTVRLRSNSLDTLLGQDANLQIILLARDPRAVMNSRWAKNWCGNTPQCNTTSQYCSELKEDVIQSLSMAKKYPGKIRIVRFEDFIANKSQVLSKALDFLGQTNVTIQQIESFFENVKNFPPRILDLMAKDGEYSYKRDSDKVPRKWLDNLSEKVAESIQDQCSEAMNSLGYPTKQEIMTSGGNLVVQPSAEIENLLIKI